MRLYGPLLVFWICLALVFYAYFGYPLLVFILARLRPCPVKKEDIYPSLSFIVAAYSEEKNIRSKLENTLALLYPKDRLQVIVVADGSTDRTVEIVTEFRSRGVELLYQASRAGKTAALNRAVPQTWGEILLFSDANTVYQPDVIQKLVRNFADPSVGGVSGRKIVLPDGQRKATQGETAYWSYESSLKAAEATLGSIVTGDGEIFAMRRSLFEPIPPKIVHDDMCLSLNIIQKGYRVVYEEEAISGEHASRSLIDEFHLKVRYVSGGYQIVLLFWKMLLQKPGFLLEFISHKVLRWMVPFFLLGIFFSSLLILLRAYHYVFWLQVAFYGIALLGWILHRRNRPSVLYFPLYFSMVNIAAFWGFFKYFTVGQSALWRKAER